MAKNVDDIRNIAVCGHGSSGKTTLVDHLLVKTGAVSGQPSVDAGTSICDFDEEEKHHKHSIEASIVHFDHAGKRFNVIDTPGYPDLIGQTIGALRAVETAVIAIDAHAGIKVNTRRVWQEAGDAGLGRILCITKLDTDNIDFPGLIDSIKEVFGTQCALFNVPIGQGHELEGRRQHARRAEGHGRRADRSGRAQRIGDRIDHRGRRSGDGEILRRRDAVEGRAAAAVRRGGAAGHAHADRLRLDEDGRRPGRAAGRARAGRAAADGRAAHGEEGRRRRDAQGRSQLRRWPPRCSRRASIRSCSGSASSACSPAR